MIPLLAASLFFHQAQGTAPVLPKPSAATVPADVRDWAGFKFLPAGDRKVPALVRGVGNWEDVTETASPDSAIWHIKVVIFDRIDKTHEHGPKIVWTGHRAMGLPVINTVRRALQQFRALVLHQTHGACDVACDIVVEAEPLQLDGGDLKSKIVSYLAPRMNGGKYDAEDGIFRGPYQSAFVLFPGGGDPQEPITVQGAHVDSVSVPAVGIDVDGLLATSLADKWNQAVAGRATAVGFPSSNSPGETLASIGQADWAAVLAGPDVSTEDRLRLLTNPPANNAKPIALSDRIAHQERGPDTALHFSKDPVRGNVLTMEEGGPFRAGGFALPTVNSSAIENVTAAPTLAFWAKTDARDPVVVQLFESGVPTRSVRLGTDVPFANDGVWHRVKIDLRPAKKIDAILIGPDDEARESLRNTLGPIVASFSDFETSTEAPDAAPIPEEPSATALTADARAIWALAAEPGEARRLLFKDPSEAVRANAVAAALARPDAADELALIDAALYNNDPNIFGPALRALANAKTPTADEALHRAMRAAAADRARGLAAEILAESHDPKLVPLILPLNQARSRAARLSAVRALGKIPGSESALMRMAFLPQDDPQIKLETTLTTDVNDDYQGRKVLWSAVNEPSDAVRLESLRRLSYSTIKNFQAEGMKGVRDDSVGVRVALLEAWAATPLKEFLSSINLALNDRSPRVRAAALDALAANSEPIDAATLTPLFADPDPQVSLAVLRLAKARKLDVPAEARDRFKKSPDPRVRAGVGEEA